MSEALTKFMLTPPRERDGARASNRFSYQADWALCHLLELQANGEEYILCLDYHDDVVEFSPVTEKFRFYQVKSKTNGNFTSSILLKREKKESQFALSYLGKLYCNYLNFPDETEGLFFIGSSRYNVKLADPVSGGPLEQDCIFLNELENDLLNRIKNQLLEETQQPSINTDIIALRVAHLDAIKHEEGALGALVKHLEKLYPGTPIQPTAFYRALRDRIVSCSNCELTYYKDIKDFIKHKAVTRGEVDELFEQYIPNKLVEVKKIFLSVAQQENFSVREQISMSKAFDALLLKSTPDNLDLREFKKIVAKAFPPEHRSITLKTQFNSIHQIVKEEAMRRKYSPEFVYAIIMECIYDNAN